MKVITTISLHPDIAGEVHRRKARENFNLSQQVETYLRNLFKMPAIDPKKKSEEAKKRLIMLKAEYQDLKRQIEKQEGNVEEVVTFD